MSTTALCPRDSISQFALIQYYSVCQGRWASELSGYIDSRSLAKRRHPVKIAISEIAAARAAKPAKFQAVADLKPTTGMRVDKPKVKKAPATTAAIVLQKVVKAVPVTTTTTAPRGMKFCKHHQTIHPVGQCLHHHQENPTRGQS